MIDNEMLEALGTLLDKKLEPINTRLGTMETKLETVETKLETVETKLETMQNDIDILKEEAAITRHTGNILLKWAEKADRTVVNVGLYDDDKE